MGHEVLPRAHCTLHRVKPHLSIYIDLKSTEYAAGYATEQAEHVGR